MKARFLLYILLVCFLTPVMFAFPRYAFLTGPVHPLVDFGPVRHDTNIDTIYFHTLRGEEPWSGGRASFARSEDNLTDTVSGSMGDSHVVHYNEKNQLLYWCFFFPGYPLFPPIWTDYEYNEEGRVIKVVVKSTQLVDNPVETIDHVYTYDYSTIQMTEEGYIYENVEYRIDNQNRLIYSNRLDNGNEYVEYTDGKKYRKGALYYTYTDSSWTSLRYNVDTWSETTNVFDENGNVILEISRYSRDGINWKIHEKTITEYVYSNAGENPMHTPPAAQTGTTVYAHSSAIHIVAKNAALTRIFDMFGRLIKQQTVSPGENRIDISSTGFYIVTVCNESFKVFIK